MDILSKKVIFSVFDSHSIETDALRELVHMARDLWSEIDYPHQNPQIENYERRLFQQYRADLKNIIILMKDKAGKSIGFCRIAVNTGSHNTDFSQTDFFIKPECRKQGYFKKLFLYSTKIVPDYVKIFKFFIRVDDNQIHPLENQSLDRKLADLSDLLGGKLAYVSRRSEVDLTKHSLEFVSQRAKELKQRAETNGYSIVFVDDISFSGLPFTRLQYVKMLERLGNDMPRDDLTQEDAVITEEDFLNWVNSEKVSELTEWIYVAVDKNGLPIAMTETKIRGSAPHLAYVGDTGVLKEHRGKKLGLTLKYLMLQKLLSDPKGKDKVKYWITFNASSNTHMIVINDELGYVQSSLEHTYEFPIKNLRDYFLKTN